MECPYLEANHYLGPHRRINSLNFYFMGGCCETRLNVKLGFRWWFRFFAAPSRWTILSTDREESQRLSRKIPSNVAFSKNKREETSLMSRHKSFTSKKWYWLFFEAVRAASLLQKNIVIDHFLPLVCQKKAALIPEKKSWCWDVTFSSSDVSH